MAAKPQHSVREVIQHLMAILVDCGVPKVSSETFRQAKFNKSEAREQFWALLLHTVQLVQFLDTIGSEEIHTITFYVPKPVKCVAMVTRRYMFSLGYSRREFHTPQFEHVCSRELLLAFSWLLHKAELMWKLATYHQREANDMPIPLHSSRQFLALQAAKDSETFRSELSQLLGTLKTETPLTGATLQQVMEKLVWMKGRVECKWQATLTSHHSYQKMADSIHRSTANSAVVSHKPPHLSLQEVFLLKHPEQLSLYLKKLEYHILCLQKLAQWRKYEGLYWQWMESVLDLSQKETEEEAGSNEGVQKEGAPSSDDVSVKDLTSMVQKLSSEVEGLLERNRPKIERLNRIWQLKSKTIAKGEIQAVEDSCGNDIKGLLLRRSRYLKKTNNTKHRVQSLNHLDHALRLPVESKPTRKVDQHFPTPGQEEREIRQKLLQVSCEASSQTSDNLRRMENGIQELKLDIIRQLSALEHSLPESVCKVEAIT